MMTFDYINCCPPLLKDYAEFYTDSDGMGNKLVKCSPLAKFMYIVMIKNASKWNITIPLNTTMSTAQINGKIAEIDPKYSPIYMFTRTELVNETLVQTSGLEDYKYNYNDMSTNADNSKNVTKTVIMSGYNN